MMVNFLIIVLIIAVAAWISNGLLNLEKALSAAKGRVRASNDSIAKLEDALKRVEADADRIIKETEDLNEEEAGLRAKAQDAQRRLAEIQAKVRPKLIILSDRRDSGDKEWVVTVANPQIGEIDTSHPLAQEWSRGREFLVWASGEREAGERTLRRFSARPGFVIRSVVQAPENLYTSGPGSRSADKSG
jgi:hypothetical protein